MATERYVKTLGVTCLHCHGDEATLSLDLGDLDAITCSDCGATFSATEARDLAAAELARWEAVVRWIDLAETL